jgi:hypothetical protein
MTDEQVSAFWREVTRARDLELERRARREKQRCRALRDTREAERKRALIKLLRGKR